MSERRDTFYPAGASIVEKVTVKDGNGDVVDVTGATGTFKLFKNQAGTPEFTKTEADGISLTDPTNGIVTVQTVPTDTECLAPGIYWYELQLTVGSNLYTALYGQIEIGRRAGSANPQPQAEEGGGGIGDACDPLVVAQTVTVEFIQGVYNFSGDTPLAGNIGVRIITSDGNPLAAPVSVEVHDLLSGTAVNPTDYTMTTPQTLNWSASEADGTVKNAVINIAGANSPGTRTVNLDLQNPSGATEGIQNTATANINEAVP